MEVMQETKTAAANCIIDEIQTMYWLRDGATYDDASGEIKIKMWKDHVLSDHSRNRLANAYNLRHSGAPRVRLVVIGEAPGGLNQKILRLGMVFYKAKEEDVRGAVIALISSRLPKDITAKRTDSKSRGPMLMIQVTYRTRFWIEIKDAQVIAAATVCDRHADMNLGNLFCEDPELISRRVNRLVEFLTDPHKFAQDILKEVL